MNLTTSTHYLYPPEDNVISIWLRALPKGAASNIRPITASASYPKGVGCFWEAWIGAIYTDRNGEDRVMLTRDPTTSLRDRNLPVWWKPGTRTAFRTTNGERLYLSCFADKDAMRMNPGEHPGVEWFQLAVAPKGMNFQRYLNISLFG